MIKGTTRLIGHLGYPTESFKAPMIYNPYFQREGIDAVVVPMGCRSTDYPDFLKLFFRLSNAHGALVTMPHKVATTGLVDVLSPTAAIAGACLLIPRSSSPHRAFARLAPRSVSDPDLDLAIEPIEITAQSGKSVENR